jgi:hypothetical protein
VAEVVMNVIIGEEFMAKEPIPYSGTGWKNRRVVLVGVF